VKHQPLQGPEGEAVFGIAFEMEEFNYPSKAKNA
jgi:hypothetical protein